MHGPPKRKRDLPGEVVPNSKNTGSSGSSSGSQADSGEGVKSKARAPSGQFVRMDETNESIAESIGKQFGVSGRTVRRAGRFVEALDKLGIHDDVMTGREKRSRKEIIAAAFPEQRKAPPQSADYADRAIKHLKKMPHDAERADCLRVVLGWVLRELKEGGHHE